MAGTPEVHHVHCDESHTGARFVVYGGIIVPGRNVEWFDAIMAEWRAEQKMVGELKWTRVANQKYAEYKSLVDLFFEHARRNRLHFKAVVFDMSEVDYAEYHNGDEELGFYKFYYQFLLHKFAPYARGDQHRLYVRIDERSNRRRHPLLTLRDALNAGIRKKNGWTTSVVKAIEPRKSKDSNLLQVADVLMGAIGWHSNDSGNRPDARQAKTDLAAHIAKQAQLASLKQGTPLGQVNFEIWRFKFSKPGRTKRIAPCRLGPVGPPNQAAATESRGSASSGAPLD